MKFSIITPHINEWYLLDIMLDSIYLQFKNSDFEVIIIDDGSDDKSHLDFVKTHLLKDKITIYFEENLWSPNARNFWATKANWEYLIFLDSHMYFTDDFLWKLTHILDTNTNIEILQPIIWNTKDKNMRWAIYKIKDFGLNNWWLNIYDDNIIETPNLAWWATIIKKEIFEKNQWFNSNFIKWWAEDLEFSMRLWLLWYKCFLVPDLFVVHYFKDKFTNTIIKSENVLYNKIIFTYTCFSNLERRCRILNELRDYYWDELYNKTLSDVRQNYQFWDWLDIQKPHFIYDDDWYFEKFKEYYPEFILK